MENLSGRNLRAGGHLNHFLATGKGVNPSQYEIPAPKDLEGGRSKIITLRPWKIFPKTI